MKRLKMILSLLLVISMLVGCSNKKADAGNDNAGGTTASNSTFVMQVNSDLISLDSSIATDGTSFTAISLMVDGLTEIDENSVVQPDLAESWDISEDGLVYTFHLVKDAKWSNGEPVTAHDFVFALQHLADPNTASEYNFILDSIHLVNAAEVISGEKPVEELGVKALDDYTLELTLSLPCGFLLSLMAFPSFFPINQKFYEQHGDQYATSKDSVLANGPYVLKDWVPGNSFSFVKNENYFKPEAQEGIVDNFEFKYIQDIQSAMLEYQSGNIDSVLLTGELVDAYKNEPGYKTKLAGYLWYLSINRLVPTLDNNDLLLAIGYSIDRDTIANNVLKNGAVAAEGFIPIGLAHSPDGTEYRQDAGKLTEYNPEKALEYYEKAKAALGGDPTITLLFEDSDESKNVAEFIQSNLETNLPGITVKLDSKPKKTRLELMTKNEFEIGLTRWGPDYGDPQTYMELLLPINTKNRYKSEKVISLVESAVRGELANDLQARWDAFKEAEKIAVTEDVGVIPVYQSGGAMVVNPKVSGISYHVAGLDNYRHVKKAE